MVASMTTKQNSRPGQFSRANPYATNDELKSERMMFATTKNTLVVYIPGMFNEYIWDDPEHVKKQSVVAHL